MATPASATSALSLLQGGATNLFTCGTLSHAGCDKRDDTATQLAEVGAIQQLTADFQSGQVDAATALQRLQQIDQAATAAYTRPHVISEVATAQALFSSKLGITHNASVGIASLFGSPGSLPPIWIIVVGLGALVFFLMAKEMAHR